MSDTLATMALPLDSSLARAISVVAFTFTISCATTAPVTRGAGKHAGCHAALRDPSPIWSPATYASDEELAAAATWWDRARALNSIPPVERQMGRACHGMSESDQVLIPLARCNDILEIKRVIARSRPGYGDEPQVQGAFIQFGDVTGLTRDWLERAITCHAARDEAVRASGTVDTLTLPFAMTRL